MRGHSLRVLVTFLFVAGVNLESPKKTLEAGKPAVFGRKVVVKRTSTSFVPPAPAPFAPAHSPAARAQHSDANRRWARFLSEYIGGQGGVSSNQVPSWAKDAVMVDLPVGGAQGSGLPSSVPVLVLPVPVPARDTRTECEVRTNERDGFSVELGSSERDFQRGDSADHQRGTNSIEFQRSSGNTGSQHAGSQSYEPQRGGGRRPQPRPETRLSGAPDENEDFAPRRHRPLQQTVLPPPLPQEKISPQELVELFRNQKPSSPQMPPVLIRERRYDVNDDDAPAPPGPPGPPAPPAPPGPSHAYLPAQQAPPPHTPAPPVFDRSLMLRGELTVYRADYTEPYTALWDASTGAARIEMHEGATTSFRTMAGGRVKRAVMSLDRTGEADAVRCVVMRDASLRASDKIPPVLPDVSKFSFDGFVEYGKVKAEMWRHTASGAAGGAGGQGAAAEALAFRHELLLMRTHDGAPMPLQYSVAVDSDLLGPDCDGYVHRYHEVRPTEIDPALFQIDLERTCESMEESEDMSRVEPLREFTMLARDARYDDLFNGFTNQFDRKYDSPAEEAVRKNLFIQSNRFVSSGNRVGATFEMAVNFLSDRLDAELTQLLGVVLDAEHFPAEAFPHERSQLRDLENDLPDEFDWRQEGGVTPVKYQGESCSSCWAFAVTGAVEGALFRVTRSLVALSEQCLVDCAQPYGGRGCGGTWPSHAYDYVQDRGLPALEEYTPYKAMVQQCRDKEVPPVTQISAHVNVTSFSVPALKVAINKHAPTVVIIDANLKSFQSYKSGVFYDDRCSKVKNKLKHAVLAVGWGVRKNEAHFILKNSWSAAWGDGGYVRLHAPSNTCGVLTLPSYPRLERGDVRRTPST